ncbi:MAG: tryptophan--tRNA ligase [Patescibacteria group bacterium]
MSKDKENREKTLLSGVKPTGRPHIGNYFGAIRQFIDLQKDYKSFISIVDLHALTSVQNAAELRESTLNVAIDFLALGVDPKKVTLFKQSDIPAHTELTWIFNCLTTMPYLMRAHAYKDAQSKDREVNVGLFDYPVLMATDILLYDADVVPVGQDQKQHLEIARDIAEKFNRTFGETFVLPEPLIQESVGSVPGTDGRKMSKSYGNTIGLFATKAEIAEAVMKIPTDSKGVNEPKDPATCNVFALHKLFASDSQLVELDRRYREGLIGYRESKEILVDQIEAFVKPLREKREAVAADKEAVIAILSAGAEVAREITNKKMEIVHERTGLSF